ncbi:hypothetical protein Fmac_021394 [Flemingia macrophylla]|uniref:TIR domain-containing protein n=1 Tax=Flemingia macrophylla TaxID=520843 RepID=A0ABD1LWR9_9FABA
MASTSNAIIHYSSSSSSMIRTYDVFVSFRGEDTRNNFTDILFGGLSKNGIEAFRDNTHLHKGKSIAPDLLEAIQASRIFIVVFSKKYASSTWCLRELAHICNCIEKSPRDVLPIFYDVDPSEVRRQSGCYKTAFAEHEERFRKDKKMMEEVQVWRETLTKVANHAGWDIQNKPQGVEIEKIIEKIKDILGCKFLCLPKDTLVGIESRVEELLGNLCLKSINDVQVVGISGMGGIGKTTLARSLYERIIDQYTCSCFIEDVSKIYRAFGTIGVQKQLLSQCLNEKNLEIFNASEGTYLTWTRLRNIRALIVFDNVDNLEQLQMFTGNRRTILCDYLSGGSIIIIISRDKHLLETHGVNYVYQVKPLNDRDAIKLFCRYAFKTNHIMSDYEKLTSDVLSHVQGHPLAIQVLGASLCNRNISQWKSALVRLKESKSDDIMNVLQISFDQLNDLDKEIFLDIACFFCWMREEPVMEILKFRGFEPDIGLQNLIDKSLITIEDGIIWMHRLLMDLGKCIVRKESPKKPRKWSRLWNFQDLDKVMSSKMGSENLEAIYIGDGMYKIETLRVDALAKVSKLKILILKSYKANFYGSLDHLCNELGYLTWVNYHLESLPPSFQPDNLVELCLCSSNIKRLWKGKKSLPNLRRLDLSRSKNLTKVPDLGEAQNICELNFFGCEKLSELHPSISLLRKLTYLNLRFCISLIKLPPFIDNPNLETLNLEGCKQLKEINPSIGLLQKLTFLSLYGCENLVSLPDSILCLNSLEYLNLGHCSKLFGEEVKKLCISEGAICSRSTSSIMKKWITSPLHLLHSRAHNDSVSCLLPSLHALPCLRKLDLCFCNLVHIPDAIRNLNFLEILNLEGNNFCTLPSLKELSMLYSLKLMYCRELKYLPELPSHTNSTLIKKTTTKYPSA